MISAAPIRGSRWVGVVPVSALLLVLLPLLLMPLAAIFIFAGSSGLDRFVAALRTPDAQFAMRFSLLIAFATALVNGVLGTFAAYVLSKYQFRGREALGVVVNLPVAIPTVVVGTSLLLLWGPIGLLGRYLDPLGIQPMFAPVGVLLAHLFVTFPYMLGAVKPVLDELDVTYEEAAYTIGARRWQTFRFVILPALRGGLFSAPCSRSPILWVSSGRRYSSAEIYDSGPRRRRCTSSRSLRRATSSPPMRSRRYSPFSRLRSFSSFCV